MYALKLGQTIYALHAVQKKSRHGIATSAHELDLIRRRLQIARERASAEVKKK